MAKSLKDILREIFGDGFGGNNYGKNFGKDFGKNFGKDFDQTPEEFMDGKEYSKTEEEGMDENGNEFTKITYTSKDGKRKFTKKIFNIITPSKIFRGTNSGKKYTLQEVISIKESQLKTAIDKEDFERASKIRDEIKKLKNI